MTEPIPQFKVGEKVEIVNVTKIHQWETKNLKDGQRLTVDAIYPSNEDDYESIALIDANQNRYLLLIWEFDSIKKV